MTDELSRHGNRGRGKGIAFLRELVGHQGAECVIWPFSNNRGYGQLGFNGKLYKAHRLLCEMVHGPQPLDKPQVAHSCGNGHLGCVNPNHIHWASQSENHSDRRRHGTSATNKYGSRTRLSLEKIEWMRSLKGTVSPYEVARQLKISEGTARRWMKSTHTPARPGTSYSSVYRRMKRNQNA